MFYNIDEVKSIPIQEVCSYYGISLKQKGQNWWGRLRTSDKTPSFSINPEKNIWRDWGIAKGGDVISLVSDIECIDSGKAIILLGEKFGLHPEYANSNEQSRILPSNNQFESIGIQAKRSILNLDINLEKQSIDELENLEEKYSISMNELAEKDKDAYHEIIDKKALPIIYENRKVLLDNIDKYIASNSFVDLKIYEDIVNDLQDTLNKRIDIYNNARLDGIKLDELKVELSTFNGVETSDNLKNKLEKDIKILKNEVDVLTRNKADESTVIKHLKEVIKFKEDILIKVKEKKELDNTQKKTDKVKELSNKLEEGIKNLFESDKYKKFLNVMSKFHNYSFRNVFLIMAQKPEATYVAGFNKWNTLKRKVNKGEKGIQILAPAPIKKVIEEYQRDSYGTFVYDNGNKVTEKVEIIIPRYKVAYVFDISQTNGEPLPSLSEELKGNINDYDNFKKALENSTTFNVGYGAIKGDAKGYCNPGLRKIMIKENMSEMQTIKTLLHEIAHAELHTTKDGKSRSVKEIEAESVAFIVTSYYGIDTSDYSFGYVAGWSSDKELEELKDSLNIIQKAASILIDKIDNNYIELFKDIGEKNIKEIVESASKKAKEHNEKIDKGEKKSNERDI